MSSLPSGYGSQSLALKYLGVPFEHWKICEWAVKSIQAYKDIHFTNEDYKEPGMILEKDDLVEILYHYGISSNYNEPMSKEQIKRLNYDKLWQIYKNIKITHNLVNIQQVKGKDLEIKDTDKFTYLLTYSFPCQDLSLAGKGKGMSDTSTRSGMLWEVERILSECKELGTMPEVLLMENVPQVHSEDNKADFLKWITRLEELGYKNYFQDLIATDYGIPQTRNRCFMVSILGDYSYSFPPKQELKLRLKDMLEDEVDEKYYLSDKQIEDVRRWNSYEKPLENMEKTDKTNISPTLTTRSGAYAAGMILIKHKPKVLTGFGKIGSTGQYHQQNRVYDDNVAISVTTAFNPYYKANLRIRKLTPKECFHLMGVKDEDFQNCAKNQSDSSLYHLAGDSIVVNVLTAIFSQML